MEEFNIRDYLTVLRRRKLAYLLSALAVFLLACAYAVTLSNYRSTATIQIQAPEIPEGITIPLGMNPNQLVEALADQRIQQIQQKVMSSAVLIDIITKFDLYADARQSKPMVDVVEGMRKGIKLELVSADLANPASASRLAPSQLGAIAFTLSFTYNDPLITQQVTNEIASRFMDEDMKQRRTQAKETAAFLEAQIVALEHSMAEQESKMAEFRGQNPESRPESLAFNQQMVATTALSIQEVDRQISTLEKTQGDLRAQLASVDPYSRVIADGQLLTTPAIQLKSLQAKYTTMTGQYGQNHPDVQKLRNQIQALQSEVGETKDTANLRSQIADTRTNLAAAEKTYGPTHPDVQSLRRQLAAQEQQLNSNTRAAQPRSAIRADADNPAYLMLVSQLQAADSQIGALAKQRESLRQDQQRYGRIVSETPVLEQQYAALSRDYDNSKLRYRDLKEKKMTADMTQDMEQGRKSERLVMIDPPELPSQTVPSKIKIIAAGFILSLFAGFGGVLAAEVLGSSNIRGTRQLAGITGIMPLVAVPHIVTSHETGKRRRVLWGVAGAGLLGAVLAVFVFDQAVMPVDVLMTVLSRRFS